LRPRSGTDAPAPRSGTDAPRRILFLAAHRCPAARPRRFVVLHGQLDQWLLVTVNRCLGLVPGRGWGALPPKQQQRSGTDAPRRILFLARADAPAKALPTPTLAASRQLAHCSPNQRTSLWASARETGFCGGGCSRHAARTRSPRSRRFTLIHCRRGLPRTMCIYTLNQDARCSCELLAEPAGAGAGWGWAGVSPEHQHGRGTGCAVAHPSRSAVASAEAP